MEFYENYYGIPFPLQKQGFCSKISLTVLLLNYSAVNSSNKRLFFSRKFFTIAFSSTDLVALPDFAAGAMENWGLITYRERALLYDEKLYTPYNKVRVALVIAHELSHQVRLFSFW